jgi:sugar lactone lactonase YvrE
MNPPATRNPTGRALSAVMKFLLCCIGLSLAVTAGGEELFKAVAHTQAGLFTDGIEGPACDAKGLIYCVKFGAEDTLGMTTPEGKATLFMKLPEGSTGNGIRLDRDGNLLVADYTGHNVLRIHPQTKTITVLAHQPEMNQPNDLALAPNRGIYASDPDWKASTGQIWHVERDGSSRRVADKMGTTNGIDVSPDGTQLYVNESVQRNVWAFDIDPNGGLSNKRLIRKFEDHGFDGMRVDAQGNLYITRHGKGTVVKMTPQGEILQEIDVLGSKPSNLCFGGPDGRTIYVTEMEKGRLVRFRVDHPGREWGGEN